MILINLILSCLKVESMFEDFIQYKTNIKQGVGKLLISEPMLLDSNFQKTVIYLCNHSVKESVGYVLNRLASNDLSYYLPELDGIQFPLFIGGPVGLNTLHFIHTESSKLGGDLIDQNIYWGGDLTTAIDLIKNAQLTPNQCKFFLGYSGWGEGQLDAEMDMNSWIVGNASDQLVLKTEHEQLWKKSIESLGDKFKNLLFIPKDPTLN